MDRTGRAVTAGRVRLAPTGDSPPEPGKRLRSNTPRVCGEPNCGRNTHELKPFCSRHLDRLWYVQNVKWGIARRDEERASNKADVTGILASDVMAAVIHRGSASTAYIARACSISHELAAKYMRALERAGLLIVEAHSRRAGTLRARLAL